jgi:hypothetical protein
MADLKPFRHVPTNEQEWERWMKDQDFHDEDLDVETIVTGTLAADTATIGDLTVTGSFEVTDTYYDDLRFPLTGRNIDVVSGRIGYDFYNGTVTFATNARFNLAETVSFIVQMPHAWKEGSTLKPHIHWLQQDATDLPNWLLGYRIYKKGSVNAIESDFSNFTLLVASRHIFTYASGALEQITTFPDVSMIGNGLSDIVHFCLWRDSANTSTEFSGADPSAIVEHVREFDIHYEINSFGSADEFEQ